MDPANQDDEPHNFSPDGSKFGGPSHAFTFFPMAVSLDPITNSDINLLFLSEHTAISQLLSKCTRGGTCVVHPDFADNAQMSWTMTTTSHNPISDA